MLPGGVPGSKLRWTALAAAYPNNVASCIADTLFDSAETHGGGMGLTGDDDVYDGFFFLCH